METAIRFQGTPGPSRNFLHVDVTGKSFKLCRLTKEDGKSLKYDTISSHSRVPPFRAFDWSPTNESLVVVGQSSGESTLLKLDDGSQESISFRTGKERLCNAVALSSQNLLAAGLDKVRTDFCLNIWDVNQRLAAAAGRSFGTSKVQLDPLHKLASSEPITSVKFFRDDPQTLVAGVKGQFVRLYDLREPSGSGSLQFATRCVNNIAIDGQDENYFASCYPTNDPEICVWDRRMVHRASSSYTGFSSATDIRQPEVSLDLKQAIDIPGQIWSLRFSKTQRGCLGVLSSNGQFRVYNIAKDFISHKEKIYQIEKFGSHWQDGYPQKLFLRSTQDLEKAYFDQPQGRQETARMVSFDFMTEQTALRQPRIIMLTGKGDVEIISTEPPPQPAAFSPLGSFYQGAMEVKASVSSTTDTTSVAKAINTIHSVAKAKDTGSSTVIKSSFTRQARQADLGFFQLDAILPHTLTLISAARIRCQAGYLLNPTINKGIVADSQWLQSFWSWIEHASRISTSDGMVQDNLDLSYLGVHALWMEEINATTREISSRISPIPRILENLVKRSNIPTTKTCQTLYSAQRNLCLYVTGMAWSYKELEAIIERLVAQKEHTKAAAIAVLADEKKLAYRALRGAGATQSHKMLAMAIAGAEQRATMGSTRKGFEAGSHDDTDTELDSEWTATIASLAEELTDPFARAILVYVRTSDWESVAAEDSLPLKYRVFVALMHLSDKSLTDFVRHATKEAIELGDVEGVILTGTGTTEALKLMTNYITRFNDLQTAVLGLGSGGAILKYVNDVALLRRYEAWRQTYRHMLNSWGLKFDRVRFDIQLQKMAIGVDGQRKIEVAKAQVALVCGYCTQSLAQFDKSVSEGEKQTAESIRETAKNPLTSEKAAAIGTVCPKCGRHLPRCGVCDLWLGVQDPSFLPWYAKQIGDEDSAVDVGASVRSIGSVRTAIGPVQDYKAPLASVRSPLFQPPATNASTGTSHGPRKESQETSASGVAFITHPKPSWEELMRRFTVFCMKCSHGFHAVHAREWFQGYGDRKGHKVCPVSTCSCNCGVGI